MQTKTQTIVAVLLWSLALPSMAARDPKPFDPDKFLRDAERETEKALRQSAEKKKPGQVLTPGEAWVLGLDTITDEQAKAEGIDPAYTDPESARRVVQSKPKWGSDPIVKGFDTPPTPEEEREARDRSVGFVPDREPKKSFDWRDWAVPGLLILAGIVLLAVAVFGVWFLWKLARLAVLKVHVSTAKAEAELAKAKSETKPEAKVAVRQ